MMMSPPDGRRGRPLDQESPPTDPTAASVTPVAFDAALAIAFLDQIFGDVNSGRLSVCYLKPDGGMGYKNHQWIRFLVGRAEEWDKLHPQGIYFRVTMLPPNFNGKRGGADDAHALAFLWADLDYGSVGHKPDPNGLPLPPDEEAARKIIADLPTPRYSSTPAVACIRSGDTSSPSI